MKSISNLTISKTCLRYLAVFVFFILGCMNIMAQEGDEDVTVGDFINSGCLDRTRGESVMGRPTLKLTRFENGLYGEWSNILVNCAYGDLCVICNEEGQNLSISLHNNKPDGAAAACLCHINVSFTIYNALKEEYQITLGGKDVGTVSFKEHSVVEIDLETLEQAYEEGFEYPLKIEEIESPDEFTDRVKPDWDLSQSLEISDYGNNRMHFTFLNYVLPCEYSYLDVEAVLDQDDVLVVNILTDGIPGKGCKRYANYGFFLINVLRDSYHLRLNHTILYKGEDGQERRCNVCLYEGDVTMPKDGGYIDIPIVDNNDYESLISNISSLHITGGDSTAPLYDLQGRRLSDKPAKGIYIQDGRKIVEK